MHPDLKFMCVGSPRLPCRTSLSLLVLKRLKGPPCIFDPLLCNTRLLSSHKHSSPAQRHTTGRHHARLVDVPIEHDTPHADVASEHDSLCGSRIVADQRVVEYKFDRFGTSSVANER